MAQCKHGALVIFSLFYFSDSQSVPVFLPKPPAVVFTYYEVGQVYEVRMWALQSTFLWINVAVQSYVGFALPEEAFWLHKVLYSCHNMQQCWGEPSCCSLPAVPDIPWDPKSAQGQEGGREERETGVEWGLEGEGNSGIARGGQLDGASPLQAVSEKGSRTLSSRLRGKAWLLLLISNGATAIVCVPYFLHCL